MKRLNLLSKPIAFHPDLARLFNSMEAAIYWQQLFYWSDKGKRSDGFVFKTKEEIEEETTLTRFQQDKIRRKLEKDGYLETKLIKANGAPTLHYRILTDPIGNKITFPLVRNSLIEKQETYFSLTENTTENTTEEKIYKKEKSKTPPSWLENLPDEIVDWIKIKYAIDRAQIQTEADAILDYCGSRGKKYTDYRATLRSWVNKRYAGNRRDEREIKKRKHEYDQKYGN